MPGTKIGIGSIKRNIHCHSTQYVLSLVGENVSNISDSEIRLLPQRKAGGRDYFRYTLLMGNTEQEIMLHLGLKK